MSKIILVAESGSDISTELAGKYGIYIVPMYVQFGTVSKPDGAFEAEEISVFYEQTGTPPKTSCSTPGDFTDVFDKIHELYPDGKILYLAYSAVTTASYQNAKLAAEGRNDITFIDTRQASAGLGSIVLKVAQLLEKYPEWDMRNIEAAAKDLIARSHMCFVPSNMDFLRAGGRCSNAAALCGNILNIHPLIEMVDGRPKAVKKYRGRMQRIIPKLIEEYSSERHLQHDELWLLYSPGLSEECKIIAEDSALQCGFQKIHWVKTGGVITCHGGPSAFGIAGFSE